MKFVCCKFKIYYRCDYSQVSIKDFILVVMSNIQKLTSVEDFWCPEMIAMNYDRYIFVSVKAIWFRTACPVQ